MRQWTTCGCWLDCLGRKSIELCLEIVDSIPKPLQRIWVHSKSTLGFRLWSHHYPSHFLLSFCSSFSCLPEVIKSDLVHKKSLGLVTLAGGCGLTRRSGAAKGKGGPIIKIRKLKLRFFQWRHVLSVLKSHFAPACIGIYKQLYRLCKRRSVRTFDLQKKISLSEAVNDGSGKEIPKL